jgi:hypothetical protein
MFVAEIAERVECGESSPLFVVIKKSGEDSPHSTPHVRSAGRYATEESILD